CSRRNSMIAPSSSDSWAFVRRVRVIGPPRHLLVRERPHPDRIGTATSASGRSRSTHAAMDPAGRPAPPRASSAAPPADRDELPDLVRLGLTLRLTRAHAMLGARDPLVLVLDSQVRRAPDPI